MISTTSNIHEPQENELLYNKFSTLFNPSTPRASPTLEDFSDAFLASAPIRPQHSRKFGSDNSFGSFVSVPASYDPLTSDVSVPTEASSSRHSPRSTATPIENCNSSLTFFENFGQSAKDAVDKKRHGYLDELLLHEDDPLYWLATGESNSVGNNDGKLTTDQHSLFATGLPSLHDVDPDFFSPSSLPKSSSPTPLSSNCEKNSHLRFDRPLNSGILSLPPSRVVPPVSVTRSPSSDLSSQEHGEGINPSSDEHNAPSTITSSTTMTETSLKRSSSVAASTLSRVVSSLRSSHRLPLDGFSDVSRAMSLPEPGQHRSGKIEGEKSPHHYTHSSRSSHDSDIPIKHGTPFSPKLRRSPFASHLYTPPSGAPGYAGEPYDWDRGFSDELARERMLMMADSADAIEVVGEPGMGLAWGRQQAIENPIGDSGVAEGSATVTFSELMDKKAGSIELLGRKEMTDVVLTVHLADKIRSHFSTFAGLPRKWNLVYSLDQHGISLNTLYSRCEAAMELKPNLPPSVGQLVVVKDSDDSLFGVWMEKEGVRRASSYYGTGDSFLWKFNHERQLLVFPWTGRNNYVALCEPTFISFGGGDGNYGLYLDDTLFSGSTAICPTFSNEPLCNGSPPSKATDTAVKFECVGLEVWAIGGK